MANLTQQAVEQINRALSLRNAPRPCALCQKPNTWVMTRGFVTLTLVGDMNVFGMAQDVPCVGLVCTNCGNTHLIDLATLGLSNLAR